VLQTAIINFINITIKRRNKTIRYFKTVSKYFISASEQRYNDTRRVSVAVRCRRICCQDIN
jgi:hypothetical protein